MRVFLLDLWLDLREKRLAPLAIALVAGLIAVPIVLSKGKDEPTVAPTTTTAGSGLPGAPVVKSDDQEGPVSSKLESFNPRDPFEPTGGRVSTADSGSTGSSGSTDTGSTGGTGSTDSGTGSTGGGTTDTGTGTGTTGGGTTGTGTSGGGTTTEKKTTFYTYTTDLRFGQTGDIKTFKDVKRLDLIPSETDPKIVFLGVTTTGKTAVFLVDSGLAVDTEGACKPRDKCTFLYLRPDADHDSAQLTDADGNTFDLRLLAIHRVAVSSESGGSTTNGNSGSGNSKRSPAFTGSTRSSGDQAAAGEEASPPGEAPPGEPSPSHPFSYRPYFGDESK